MIIENFKRVLILAPHTDDGELRAGGTIAKLIANGSDVYYAAFSTAEESVPAPYPKDILRTEVKDATKKLGIKNENLMIFNYQVRKLSYHRQEILEDLMDLKRKIKPDLVFMPIIEDIHQDHSTVAQEGLRAFKNTTLLGYELIWNNLSFKTSCFVDIDKSMVEKKCDSLREYKSQSHRDYMNSEFIFSLAKARGVQIGVLYAEAFDVIRLIL